MKRLAYTMAAFLLVVPWATAQEYTTAQRAAMQAYSRGARLAKQGQPDQAIAAFTEAIGHIPRYAEAYYQRGRVYLIDKKQYDRAFVDFQKTIALKPKFAGGYNGRGLCHYYNARFDKAEADFTAAIERDANFIKPWFNRGLVRAWQERWKEAVADYTQVIRLQPSIATVYASRAEAYLGQGNPAQAIADCNAALGLVGSGNKPVRGAHVNVPVVYLVRGKAHAARKDLATALKDIQTAFRLSQGTPPARFFWYRGDVYAQQGNLQQALADYQHGLKVGREFQSVSTQDFAYNQLVMANIHRSRGAIYAKLSQPAKAEAELARADVLDPKRVATTRPSRPSTPKPQPPTKPAAEDFAWKEFVFADGKFKVDFPAKVETYPTKTKDGKPRWIILSVHNSRAFGVECSAAPPQVKTRSEEQIRQDLVKMTEAFAKNEGGKIDSADKLTVNGYPGRRVRYHSAKMKSTIYKQIVITGDFLYELGVQVPDGRHLDEKQALRFLSSFKLLEPKVATQESPPANQPTSPTPALPENRSDKAAWAGFLPFRPVLPKEAREANVPLARGAFVCFVYPDSPADKAGVRVGDIVTKMDGRVIVQDSDVAEIFMAHDPGDRVEVEVARKEGRQTLSLTFIARPAREDRHPSVKARAEAGDPLGMFTLAMDYAMGRTTPLDMKQAIVWMRKAADRDEPEAMRRLGNYYAYGHLEICPDAQPVNLAEAEKWLKQAIEQGHPLAALDMGNVKRTQKEYAEAVRWYRLAADYRIREAMFNLALSYELGKGVPHDPQQAIAWYRRAAEEGYARAQYDLGISYKYGNNVEQNDAEAARWFRMAAEQGHSPAQNSLGVLYYEGQGVPRDYNEAVKWYRRAIASGSGELLGESYLHQDLHRTAANHARYNLALCYLHGLGVPQDQEPATKLLRESAAGGYKQAAVKLQEIGGASAAAQPPQTKE